MFDYIKRKYIEQRMYHEAFENDASYDEKNPMAKWDSGLWIRYKLFENVLASIPSADVIEPKRGRWIEVPFNEKCKYIVCSECGNKFTTDVIIPLELFTKKHKFCHNCGADMRERKGE